MSDHANVDLIQQEELFDELQTRSLLDRLLIDSRLYRTSKDYQDLLTFVARLRNFAPFNAMLLQVQKPGLRFAASAQDWRVRFNRFPKEGARPLLILWPFGPVALVYDSVDTDGAPMPEDVSSFIAIGPVDHSALRSYVPLLARKNIKCHWVDAGDGNAGLVRVTGRGATPAEGRQYAVHINKNHPPQVQFATLTHELAHLTLGHLGPDKKLGIPARPPLAHAKQELEAESVAYILCERVGVASKSQTYLSSFVAEVKTIDDLDVYQIMRAAGQVETMLGLAHRSSFNESRER